VRKITDISITDIKIELQPQIRTLLPITHTLTHTHQEPATSFIRRNEVKVGNQEPNILISPEQAFLSPPGSAYIPADVFFVPVIPEYHPAALHILPEKLWHLRHISH